jgi:hypothetical protein
MKNTKSKTPVRNTKEDTIRDQYPQTITISSTWTSKELLDEWEENCQRNFGDCRWMKMWNDHLAAKYYMRIIEELEMVKSRLAKLEKKEVEPEIKTLGK